jgi:hypothetical protein
VGVGHPDAEPLEHGHDVGEQRTLLRPADDRGDPAIRRSGDRRPRSWSPGAG